MAEHLLAVEADRKNLRPVLADNRYCGDHPENLFGRKGGQLWYALRRSQSPDSTEEMAPRAWHRGKRARIESVFGSLADQFNLEETRARSLWGAMTRVVAKLLAYMVGYRVNQALGRRQTALKSLYRYAHMS